MICHARSGWWMVFVVIGLTAGPGCGSGSGDAASKGGAPGGATEAAGNSGDSQREMAPDFTLRDIHGGEVSLRDYRGKVVFLNFWATWCGPCRREIPDMIQLQDEHPEDLAILGISLDREGVGKVKPFAESMGMTYPVLVDGDPVAGQYGPVNSIPMTFVIDRHGRLVEQVVGLRPKSYFQGLLTHLLREG